MQEEMMINLVGTFKSRVEFQMKLNVPLMVIVET